MYHIFSIYFMLYRVKSICLWNICKACKYYLVFSLAFFASSGGCSHYRLRRCTHSGTVHSGTQYTQVQYTQVHCTVHSGTVHSGTVHSGTVHSGTLYCTRKRTISLNRVRKQNAGIAGFFWSSLGAGFSLVKKSGYKMRS